MAQNLYINPGGGQKQPFTPQAPMPGPPQYKPPTDSPILPIKPQGPGAGTIRATGPSSGFDPNYLQNLAVSDAQGITRPSGGLAFNPLGNFTDIPGVMPTGGGNAPVMGLPPTMLQQSLAQNPTFQQGQTAGTSGGANSIQTLAQMLQQAFGGGNNLLQLFGLAQ